MLKKAGIVVATVAAGLLAVSPLAFAGDEGYEGHDGSDVTNVLSQNLNDDLNGNEFANGLVSGNNISVPVNACHNQIPVNVLGVQVPVQDVTVQATDLLGGIGLLGGEGKDKDSGDTVNDESCGNEVGQVSGDNGNN